VTEPEPKPLKGEAAGRVAIILAIGISVALNFVTVALLYAAIVRLGIDSTTGLSDNGVQVLLAWGGGIISVLAGYVGYIVGKKTGQGETSFLPPEKPKPVEPSPTEQK
jgi:hypothetical protein